MLKINLRLVLNYRSDNLMIRTVTVLTLEDIATSGGFECESLCLLLSWCLSSKAFMNHTHKLFHTEMHHLSPDSQNQTTSCSCLYSSDLLPDERTHLIL